MANPVLVEVTRGGRVESRHRGALAIVDAEGRSVLQVGDVDAPVFPRSAVKALQALPMVESGAADAFGFGARELALSQASHSGEPEHVELVTSMLAALGLGESDLECGPQTPTHRASAAALVRDGRQPDQRHNNCSGKHANFLAFARRLGVETRGYVSGHHPVQQAVRATLEDLTGAVHGAAERGVDGCSIPTYAASLDALARGFARFAAGAGMEPARAHAAKRLYDAAIAEPFFIAGTGKFDTEVIRVLDGAALVKTGAEGVYCAAIPGGGFGVALKCDDGGTRASEAMMAAVLARLMPRHEAALRRWSDAPVLTRRGVRVGAVRALPEAFGGIGALA